MNDKRVNKVLNRKRIQKHWRIIGFFVLIVTLSLTFYHMILPAITQEESNHMNVSEDASSILVEAEAKEESYFVISFENTNITTSLTFNEEDICIVNDSVEIHRLIKDEKEYAYFVLQKDTGINFSIAYETMDLYQNGSLKMSYGTGLTLEDALLNLGENEEQRLIIEQEGIVLEEVNMEVNDLETSFTLTIDDSDPNVMYIVSPVFVLNEESVDWGTSIDSEALLNECKNDEIFDHVFDTCIDASGVYNVFLTFEEDSEQYKEFIQVISNNLNEEDESILVSTYQEDIQKHVFDITQEGYYYIQRIENHVEALSLDETTDETEVTTVQSQYMRVIQRAKATTSTTVVPTVEIKVKENSYINDDGYGVGYNDVADYSVGDSIPFKIYGEIPSSVLTDSNSKYVITNSFSHLTYISKSMNVYLATSKDIDVSGGLDRYTDANGNVIAVKVNDKFTLSTGSTGFTLSCNSLKDAVNNKLTGSTYVLVDFSATLDSDAATGNSADKDYNLSTSILKYADNSSSKTDSAMVFTYWLQTTKVDQDGNSLGKQKKRAEFYLYRMNGDQKEYAIFKGGSTSKEVASWEAISDDQLKKRKDDILVKTDTSDGTAKIRGLDAGTYYLYEYKSPDGYDPLFNDVELTITSTFDTSNKDLQTTDGLQHCLTGLSITYEEVTGTKQGSVEITDDNLFSGYVFMNVTNYIKGTTPTATPADPTPAPEYTLPETGGTGYGLLYGVGIGMMVSVLIIVVCKRGLHHE